MELEILHGCTTKQNPQIETSQSCQNRWFQGCQRGSFSKLELEIVCGSTTRQNKQIETSQVHQERGVHKCLRGINH